MRVSKLFDKSVSIFDEIEQDKMVGQSWKCLLIRQRILFPYLSVRGISTSSWRRKPTGGGFLIYEHPELLAFFVEFT